MRKKLTAVLVVVLSLVAVTAGPAQASSTFTVTPGGNTTAAAINFKLTDLGTGNSVICMSSAVQGNWHSGNIATAHPIVNFSSGAISGCKLSFLTVTVSSDYSVWDLEPTVWSPPVMTMVLASVMLTISGGCSLRVASTTSASYPGQVSASHSNATPGQLTVGPTSQLRLWNVSPSCLGLMVNGDNASLSETYTLTPPQTITSP